MDLIREILSAVGAMDFSEGESQRLEITGRDKHLVYGHARLLVEAGYLRALFTHGSSPRIRVMGLTWSGQDLLHSIRDDSVWSAVKKQLASVGGTVSIDLIRALAGQIARSELGLLDG